MRSVVNALSEYFEVKVYRDGKIYYQRYYALSEYFEVKVYRDGKIYYQRYSRGIPQAEVLELGETD